MMWAYRGTDYNNDYLAHHGILGQKWGVRRFQNPDGTLTPEGRQRYLDANTNRSISKYEKRYRKQGVKISEDTKRAIDDLNEARADKKSVFEKRDKRLVARANMYADRGDAIRKQGNLGAKKILKRLGITALTLIPLGVGMAGTIATGKLWPYIAGLSVSLIGVNATAAQFNKTNQAVRNSLYREQHGAKKFNEIIRNRDSFSRY